MEERAARFRSLLFKRRALVVLDNAADEAQVRPLLPGGPSCLVLVTSRSLLAGLETPHRLLLDVLSPADALALLTEVAGARVVAEPAAAAEVSRCAATCRWRCASRRTGSPASRAGPSRNLATGCATKHARLKELQAGDLQVRAALALSYGQVAKAATAEVAKQLSDLPRSAVARVSLDSARLILVPDLNAAAEVVNAYAPEHLSLAVADADALLPLIRNAGAVFAGRSPPRRSAIISPDPAMCFRPTAPREPGAGYRSTPS